MFLRDSLVSSSGVRKTFGVLPLRLRIGTSPWRTETRFPAFSQAVFTAAKQPFAPRQGVPHLLVTRRSRSAPLTPVRMALAAGLAALPGTRRSRRIPQRSAEARHREQQDVRSSICDAVCPG